jgi:DNA-binding beta-propeller fold protein YncE
VGLIHREPLDPIGRGTLIVANAGAGSVSLLDALTGDRILDLPAGDGPGDMAVSPDGLQLVVADRGGATPGHDLTVIAVAESSVTASIDLGQHARPGGLHFMPDGRRLLAASGSTGHLLIVDVGSRRLVRAVPTGHTHAVQLAVEPDGKRAWISHGSDGAVTAVDTDRLVSVGSLRTGDGAEGLEVTPDGEQLWVCNQASDTVAVIDLPPGGGEPRLAERLTCSGGPSRVRFSLDGHRAFVANSRSGDIAVFAVGKREQIARIPLALTPLEISDSRLFGHTLPPDAAVDTSPTDLLPTHDGRQLWVSHGRAGIVSVLDLERLDVAHRLRAGREPAGLAWTPVLPGQY